MEGSAALILVKVHIQTVDLNHRWFWLARAGQGHSMYTALAYIL